MNPRVPQNKITILNVIANNSADDVSILYFFNINTYASSFIPIPLIDIGKDASMAVIGYKRK